MDDACARARRREYGRRERLREAAEEEATHPRFVCAKCGREFEADTGLYPQGRGRKNAPPASMFVLIGGRPWCSRCAQARYPRRPDPDAPVGADRIELIPRPTAARLTS